MKEWHKQKQDHQFDPTWLRIVVGYLNDLNKCMIYFYLLLSASKRTSFVRFPISLGRVFKWLWETYRMFKDMRDPSAGGKVVKLKKWVHPSYVKDIIDNLQTKWINTRNLARKRIGSVTGEFCKDNMIISNFIQT